MEADIKYLMTKKIREVLDLCGIHEYSHEAVQQHASTMARFVQDARLQAGLEASTCHSDIYEGSYRAIPRTRKRGLADHETDDPVSKKGTTWRERSAPRDDEIDTVDSETSQTSDEWHESSYGVEPETRQDAERERLATAQRCTSPPWEPLDVNSPMTPLSSGSAPPYMHPPTRSTSTSSERVGSACASPDPLLPAMPDWHLSQVEKQVIESILVDCVALQRKLGMSTQGSERAVVGKIVEGTQTLAQRISELDYEGAVQAVQNQSEPGDDGFLRRCLEVRYWDIILRGAERLDPQKLPTSRGRQDGFTRAQKEATRLFMAEIGFNGTLAKQRECRILWKTLFDMRNAGVNKILLYHTKRFDNFCKGSRNDAEMSIVDMALRWERFFGPQIDLLEARVAEECDGGLTGRSWLQQPFVTTRLLLEPASWSSATNPWYSRAEESAYGYKCQLAEACNCHRVGSSDVLAAVDGPFNKSIFVTLLPRNETSLLVCPIVTIHEGDFLGVFAGEIRYSELFDDTHGIRGPCESIWLDYGRVSGTLNLVRVTMDEDEANVYVFWEPYREDDGSPVWRVSVRALRTIEPFEELTRHTPQAEQARLHQDHTAARRGFTRSPVGADSSARTP